MVKRNIDYSKTIIYKLCCKDTTITDLYVGHTTNFELRQKSHKDACNNLKNTLKIYTTIRENGGWNNWDMIQIEKYNCNNLIEAKIKEQYYYEELKATLNSIPPHVDNTKYFCNSCNLQCNGLTQFNIHLTRPSHIKHSNLANNADTTSPSNMYKCDACKFYSNNKYDYSRHMHTNKHNKKINNIGINSKYECDICNDTFNDRAGLWRHKKKCTIDISVNAEDKYAHLLELLINANNELKLVMTEQQDILMQILSNVIDNNNTTTNNVATMS
jgi:hypothetical protein